MDEEQIRNRLQKVLMKLIGDTDYAGIEHPYWDEDTVEAMTDAAMAVLSAVVATQSNKENWAG